MRIRILTPFRSVYAELFSMVRAVDLRLLLLLNITEVCYPLSPSAVCYAPPNK